MYTNTIVINQILVRSCNKTNEKKTNWKTVWSASLLHSTKNCFPCTNGSRAYQDVFVKHHAPRQCHQRRLQCQVTRSMLTSFENLWPQVWTLPYTSQKLLAKLKPADGGTALNQYAITIPSSKHSNCIHCYINLYVPLTLNGSSSASWLHRSIASNLQMHQCCIKVYNVLTALTM